MVKRKKSRDERKICYQCSKDINIKKEHYVLLGTYNRAVSPNEENYFHFQCWVDYFMKIVADRSKIQLQGMQKQVMEIVDNPMIKGLLEKVSGSKNLLNMIQLPLETSKQKVERKIKDGRKRNNKRKSKM